jgi:hypothetical protein
MDDSSPELPITLGRLHGDERGDSDYCSDNSKDFAQVGTSQMDTSEMGTSEVGTSQVGTSQV